MDINKEAEQLKKELNRIKLENRQVNELTIEAILQSFERICREQREACQRSYKGKQAENIVEKLKEAHSTDYEGKCHDLSKAIMNTPLLTDNN